MALPLVLFAAGTGLSIFGQWQANLAQAQAELDNAQWLQEQASFANRAMEREGAILGRQGDDLLAEQAGTLVANGITLSGSALDVLDNTERLIGLELEAIKDNGRMQVREALLKSTEARNNARSLSDPMNNLLQGLGTGLSGAGQMLNMHDTWGGGRKARGASSTGSGPSSPSYSRGNMQSNVSLI